MILLSECPLCSGKNFSEYLTCTDFTTTQENFKLKQCDSCALVFTDPKPDEDAIGKYYQSDKYISHTGGNKSIIDSIYLAARKFAIKSKRRLVEQESKGKSILDIGCGTGEFLHELKNHQWEISGVEPSSVANTKAAAYTQTRIYTSLSQIRNETYDVITLWHVLEHLHDLNGSMKKISDLLNQTGTILIAVPNLQSYDAKVYQAFWAAYDAPRHLWHFNKNNMKQLLTKHGFRLTKIVPMKMDSYYVSMLSESYENPTQSKLVSMVKAAWVGLKSNILARKELNYSSLIYVAKR